MTEEKETKPMVAVMFRLDVLRPDKRQYKQQSMELIPTNPLEIITYVPCTLDYVSNSADINAATLGTDTVPDAIFTPGGLAYISNEIEQHFSDPEPADFELVEGSEEWTTDEKESSDDGWEKEKEMLSEKSDDGWDTETNEKSDDTEKWNEDEEEW